MEMTNDVGYVMKQLDRQYDLMSHTARTLLGCVQSLIDTNLPRPGDVSNITELKSANRAIIVTALGAINREFSEEEF